MNTSLRKVRICLWNRIRIRAIARDDAHNNILKLPIVRIIRDNQDGTLLGCAEVRIWKWYKNDFALIVAWLRHYPMRLVRDSMTYLRSVRGGLRYSRPCINHICLDKASLLSG